MNPEQLPADIANVVLGVCATAFLFFVMGVSIGRRLAPTDLRAVRRALVFHLQAAFTSLEELMVTISEKLEAGLADAGAKIDGLSSIVATQATVLKGVEDALRAMKDAPTSEKVDALLTELGTHIASLADAVKTLDEADDEPQGTAGPATSQPPA